MSLRLKLLQGGTWLTIGFVIGTLIQTGVNVILAWLLSPAILGDYYLLINIVNFLVIVASMGMSQAVMKLIPASVAQLKPSLAKQYVTKSLIISLTATLIVSVIFFSFFSKLYPLFFYSEFSNGLSILIVVWLVLLVLQGLFSAVLRAFYDLKSEVIFSNLLPKVLFVIGLYFIWQLDDKLPTLIALLISISLVAVIALFFRLKAHLKTSREKNQNNEGQSMTALAFPLWTTSLMLYVLTNEDIWIIGYFLTTSDVAIYGSVLKLTIFLNLVFNLLITIITPAISELYHKQAFNKLESLIRVVASVSSVPALILTLMFFMFGAAILGFVFGEFYASGDFVLKALSIGIIINILTGPCGTALMFTNHQKYMMSITVISALFTIISALILVKPYGINGVAVASSMGMILQNTLMFIGVRRKLGIWTHFSFMSFRNIGIFGVK